MNLKAKIESLLFVSTRPLTVKRLAEVSGASKEDVKTALDALVAEYDAREGSGLVVLRNGEEVQLATAPDLAEMVKQFLKDETFGELTRPALETLTIVAYRGPITKAELEQIRGINCSLILRNLMIRGLVEVKEGAPGEPTSTYAITFDFIRYLGLKQVAELPDYETLRSEENLKKLLDQQQAAQQQPAPAVAAVAAPAETAPVEATEVAEASEPKE
jgi:segregation and condensation protein B